MSSPGGGIIRRAAQEQDLGEGFRPPSSSTARPPTQLLRISASHLARDRLLNLALCCLIEARRHRPSGLLDQAAINIALDQVSEVAEGGR